MGSDDALELGRVRGQIAWTSSANAVATRVAGEVPTRTEFDRRSRSCPIRVRSG